MVLLIHSSREDIWQACRYIQFDANHFFFFLGFLTSSSKIFTFELHLVRVQQSFNYLTILKWDGFGTRTLFRFFDFPTILTNHMTLSTAIPMMFSSRETTFTNVAFQFFVENLIGILLCAFCFRRHCYLLSIMKFECLLFSETEFREKCAKIQIDLYCRISQKSYSRLFIDIRLRIQCFHPWLKVFRGLSEAI